MDLIKNRQKLIKLADSSDAGWRVVEEYVTNPLAEDSEDEKKMYKAQSRAESKLKKEKLKRRPDRKSVPYTQQAPAKTANSIPVNVSGGSRSDVRPGRCFYCNEYGHWIRNCPKSAAEQKHKISIDTTICKIDKVEMYTHPKTDLASGELYSMRNVNSITQTSRDVQSMSNTHTTTIVKYNGTGVGHLKESLSEWKRIGATDFVLDIIANGYKIPFSTIPCMVELQNNKSARDNPEFVKSEIEKLLEKGCITQVSRKPYVVNPLTVAHNRGSKLRLVLDARHINPHVVKFKHKYEDAKTARQLYDQGDFVFSYDLKSAYHHISIFETDTTYLGFKWEHEYYVYNVLPFGLSTSGYIFTKVVREVIKYWRSTGLKIVMYLDDGLGGGKNMKEAMLASEKIHSDLEKFGFVLASEKCNWVPIQGLDWLGFHWDMIEGVIRITEKRIEKLLRILEVFRIQFHYGIRLFRVKFIASLVGQIISMQPVLGDQARLRTRYLYQCILQRASWNAKVLVSTDAFEECIFWEHKVESFNEIGSRLSQLTYNVPQDYYVFSDASGTGFGGFVTTGSEDEPLEMFGSWSMAEQAESSTWRELEAVKRLLINFVNILSGITLDNTVKEAVQDSGIEVGSYMYELYPKMCELLINSKSDNTVKSYFNSYKRWERFITLQGHKSLPAQPVHVALYLTHLLNNNSTCHPISNAVYGIKWAHEINGLNDPTSNTFVTSILEASKRVAPKKDRKERSNYSGNFNRTL
ncbi:Hypothetical predicted protein [Mytilus galloprovincialis]|uniref:CCHC-type domain-containing protein n=1 Tax=Mytilus galloprovincialis TaxID=29158 RepID=A0A8B6DJG3_MYTGA|nr:Hypothetical predicted protein [Mytilus galloprovincialis]